MREIKFKGKRADNGDWVIGSLVMVRDGESLRRYPCIVISFNHDVFDWHEVIPDTVGQFTGLKDKNGKEIFEGDIYKRSDDYYLVTCTTLGGFLYRQIYDSWTKRNIFGKMEQSWLSAVECYKYEIIGNIHDNPELIK